MPVQETLFAVCLWLPPPCTVVPDASACFPMSEHEHRVFLVKEIAWLLSGARLKSVAPTIPVKPITLSTSLVNIFLPLSSF